MASVQTSNAPGGKRSLNAEINLVPFIDLLSMCICFLLMTAVWVEVSSIQIKQILGTEGAAVADKSVDLRVQLNADHSLAVFLERGGKLLQKVDIGAIQNKINLNGLGNLLGLMSKELTDPGSAPDTTARIIPNSAIHYDEMISVLDILRSYGVTQLAIVPIKE